VRPPGRDRASEIVSCSREYEAGIREGAEWGPRGRQQSSRRDTRKRRRPPDLIWRWEVRKLACPRAHETPKAEALVSTPLPSGRTVQKTGRTPGRCTAPTGVGRGRAGPLQATAQASRRPPGQRRRLPKSRENATTTARFEPPERADRADGNDSPTQLPRAGAARRRELEPARRRTGVPESSARPRQGTRHLGQCQPTW